MNQNDYVEQSLSLGLKIEIIILERANLEVLRKAQNWLLTNATVSTAVAHALLPSSSLSHCD